MLSSQARADSSAAKLVGTPLTSALAGALPPPTSDLGVIYLLNRHTGETGSQITFPARAATAEAIRRIAGGEVSSAPNRCAHTMREALGWGLGDAHEWVRLPDMGFARRPPGTPAEPGDITVWPFTYGSRGSQHIGIAVGTTSGIRLLSNLSGTIRLSDLVPGYVAFYRPLPPPPATDPELLPTVAPSPHSDPAPAAVTAARLVRPGQAAPASRAASSAPTAPSAASGTPRPHRSLLVFDPGVPAPTAD
jgi:hypothetical protein